MKRKLPGENVTDFAHMDDADFATLRRKLARWADDNWAALSKAQPQIPAGFHNRVRRNWWLLMAIAELAGSDWADRARKAAISIEGVQDVGDIETELLADIKGVFDAGGLSEIRPRPSSRHSPPTRSAPGLLGSRATSQLPQTTSGGCFASTAL